jgi:class 3 adenylate cyclase
MNLLNRFQTSLRYKLAAVMLLISIGSLVIVAVITLLTLVRQLADFSARLNEAETALRSDVVGRNLSSAAADTVTDIDTFLLERIQDIRRISEESSIILAARQGTEQAVKDGLADIADDPAAVQAKLGSNLFLNIDQAAFSNALSYVFAQTEQVETPFVEIIVTEAHGINVLVTRPVEQVAYRNESWWQAAAASNQAGIGIMQPFFDGATGLPVVGIALPVIDNETKEVIGVIRALVNLSALQKRLSQKAVRLDVQINVYNNEGSLIAETASNNDPKRLLNPDVTPGAEGFTPADQALQTQPGPEGAGFTSVDMSGNSLIVGFARSAGSDFYDSPAQLSGFSGFNWGATVSQPEQRALQVLSRLIQTGVAFGKLPSKLVRSFIILTAVVAAIALALAIFFATGITRPLIQLNQMSRRVQEGDLTVQVDIPSRDEVGELGQAFNNMTEGLRQRERERDIFGKVVSPEVREKLLSGKLQLGGETRWVSVLFSDIRSFSTISEKMTAQDVVTFLNEYLSEMSDAIKPFGGYINNFIGDAIVAIFGAPIDQPDKEWRSVAAAIAMRQRLETLNDRRMARGEAAILSGIGISSGEVVAGQIGSLERLLYTVIGDAVNVAARLEALTKDYPEYSILINKQTAEAIKDRSSVNLQPLGPIQVKGRSEPVEVFAVTELE